MANYWIPIQKLRDDHRRRYIAPREATGALDMRDSRPHTVISKIDKMRIETWLISLQ